MQNPTNRRHSHFLLSKKLKPPRLPVTETGAVQYCLIKLYALCISTSRNYLRGFLIAAWAAARRAIGTRKGEQLT